MNIFRLLIPFLALTLLSCNNKMTDSIDSTKQLTKGELIYNVSGEYTTSGWSFNVKFDKNNVRINEKYALTASQTKIIDKKSNEALCLYSDFKTNNLRFKDTYLIYKTTDEVFKENKASYYGRDTIKTITNEFKNILGFNCQKIILKTGNQAVIELWTTDLIKTGVRYPSTPLAFENIALEYELKVLGEVEIKYTIKEIKNLSGTDGFNHLVPKNYNLLSYFNLFGEDRIVKEYNSVTHPYFSEGRKSVKIYLENKLSEIHKKLGEKSLKYSIEFIVTKEGDVEDVKIHSFIKTKKYNDFIVNIFENTPKWNPGMVRGNPVNTEIKIIIE